MSRLKSYWSYLRRMRLLHYVHNVLHAGSLQKNKSLYERFEIRKGVFSSVSHKDIRKHSSEVPWADRPDARNRLSTIGELPTPLSKEDLEHWIDNGYLILPKFFSDSTVDQVNRETQDLIATHAVDFDYTNSRVMNIWRKSNTARACITDSKLRDVLSTLLGKKVVPFQSISFLKGSRQKTHSDFIHMSTEPHGYLIAIWIALEDIQADSGPLHYYPGSHRLPYVMGEDFDHSSNSLVVGDDLYGNYEKKIAAVVEERQLQKKVFLARKGDVLIWHANLLHGGEPVTNPDATRKSLVAHYFCEGEILCYHEITQRPAIIQPITGN